LFVIGCILISVVESIGQEEPPNDMSSAPLMVGDTTDPSIEMELQMSGEQPIWRGTYCFVIVMVVV
jgi:hypothetical protein